MNLYHLISKINDKRHFKVTWVSDLASSMTDEAKRKGFIVTKKVTSVVEVNREGGNLPWGTYYQVPYLIRYHNKIYIRLLPKEAPEIEYYVNGVKFERSEFEKYPLMKPNYWLNKDTKTVNGMVLKINNITNIEVV